MEKAKVQRRRVFLMDSIAEDASDLSNRNSRLQFSEVYSGSILQNLDYRNAFHILENKAGVTYDLTPELMEDHSFDAKLRKLHNKINKHDLMRYPSIMGSTHASQDLHMLPKLSVGTAPQLDEIALHIAASQAEISLHTTDFEAASGEHDEEEQTEELSVETEVKNPQPFIKIVLRKSRDFLLFEQRSSTAPRDTEEGNNVEEDNKLYDYMTTGKGRIRRTTDSEAQTKDVLLKSRDVNTYRIFNTNVVSYVSNFEMFDTFRSLQATTKNIDMGEKKQLQVTTYTVGGVDKFKSISKSPSFNLALMVATRILSSNVYEHKQRRYRNMIKSDPLSKTVEFKYRLELLFRFESQTEGKERKAIADIAFCPGNSDILAAAYGLFSFTAMHVTESGYCCIWNIKNPVNPERIYHYNMPVVSVQFSPFSPQLLAIGLYDGSVQVRDITNYNDPPIAYSVRGKQSTCEPITAMEWIPQQNITDRQSTEIEPLLALAQNGSVTKYRIINSPYLLAFPQIQLDRVEGSPEGILVRRDWNTMQANRQPQGLFMTLNPLQRDIYYVLTDEGCIHKCSTNYPHQHLEVLQVHKASVSVMDFSPWSPKLFLTCGNDWCIRIWMESILEPLITLKNEISPVLSAGWSRTHSTIIVSNTRNSVEIWDLRRSILKPMSSTNIDKSFHTIFKFSPCGRSIALGNERGNILMVAFEDMPFPPHFQYQELERALYAAISNDAELTKQLHSVGYFGFPHEHHRDCPV